MKEFTVHRGVAAPLLRTNVDTDAIIPSREMKLVSKQGLGEGLFAGWRYTEAGSREPNPEFVLNQPDYADASILLSGVNFGCGSSREHAVWSLREFGIRAILAESFGTIFYNNCTRNGVLPIVLGEEAIKLLAQEIQSDPQMRQLQIDLPKQQVTSPSGQVFGFEIDAAPKEMLVQGLDPIAMTMKSEGCINHFEQEHRQRMPWLFQN